MIQINMTMPNSCSECKFMDEDHGDYPYCWALNANRGYKFPIREKRFPNCPLKQIKNEENKENKEEPENKKDHMIRVLFNRCRAVGSCNGALCVFCGLKKECKEYEVKENDK